MSATFLSQSVPGPSSLAMFARSAAPQHLQTYLQLEQAELLRLRRYNEYWRFFMGQHWSFTREDGEPLVTMNYCRRIVLKIADWLVGAGMNIDVPPVFVNHTKVVLDDTWKDNLRNLWLYNMAIQGGVTGDVFALVTYAEPTPSARRRNPHTQGRIWIQLLNSEQVFCTWDPMNKDNLLQVRIETIYYDTLAAAQQLPDNSNSQRQLHVRRFTQIITRDRIIEQFQGAEPVARENVLGEIALVHIKNQPVPGEFYGLSDIDGVVELNRELNEKSTDMSDIINYHAMPITVITGAKVGELERSPKQIWSGLPADADVKNLQMDAPSGSMDYIKMIREVLLEMSNVPEGSLGKQQQISNTSGVALHVQYQPLVEIRDRKRPFYQTGLEEVNYFILRIKEITDLSFKLPTDLCRNCGGRIVELVDDKGNRKKRCYKIDPQTFEFLPPDKVEIPVVRQHSFGNEVAQMPLGQAKEEHNQHAPSAWDPEPSRSAEAVAKERQVPELDEMGQPVPQAQKPYEPPSMSEVEKLPPEPETITIVEHEMDPMTGELREVGSPREMQVVWTECERPAYLDPYTSTVTLNDTVPKDKVIESTWHQALLGMEVVSPDWIREHTPEIEDPVAEKKRVEEWQKKRSNMAAKAGGHLPPSGSGSTGTPPSPDTGASILERQPGGA